MAPQSPAAASLRATASRGESSPGCVGSAQGTQIPASPGTAPSTMPSNVGASRFEEHPQRPEVEPRLLQDRAAQPAPLRPEAKRVLVVQQAPREWDCQASGNRRSASEASPSHNLPKTSATEAGSGRGAARISSSSRRSRAAAEPSTPRSTPNPRARSNNASILVPSIRKGTLQHAAFAGFRREAPGGWLRVYIPAAEG
jgi:hypothetical protein